MAGALCTGWSDQVIDVINRWRVGLNAGSDLSLT